MEGGGCRHEPESLHRELSLLQQHPVRLPGEKELKSTLLVNLHMYDH